MSASASINPSTNRVPVIARGNTAGPKVSMRDVLTLLRDASVVLGLQLVFRTMMFLRKLNY